MAVCLTGPRRHRVVLGSFTPRPLLWDSELSSIRVNDFAKNKTNFRFSQVLSPGEPLVTDDRLLHQKIPKILYDVLSRLCAIAFAIHFHR